MAIMLSYSRRDEVVVKALASDLEAAKRQVWFDHNLVGGDAWWDSILRNIRSATVFLFALSDASLNSKPCRLELDYAFELDRPIVPVRVGPVHSLRTSPLAALQIIDYSPDQRRSGFAVLAAIDDAAARERPLPDPLPPPPPIPYGYLLALGRQIDSAELSLTEQLAAVDQLRRALGEETEESVRQDIVTMLKNLNSKPWTAKRIEREVAALLYAYVSEQRPEEGAEDRTATGQPGRPDEAEPARPAPARPAPDRPAPDRPAPDRPAPDRPAPDRPAPAGRAPAGPTPAEPAPSGPTPASPVGAPEVILPGIPETDPREWFAQRLEQMQRQRAAEEETVAAPPPPWRPAPEAADRWSRTFGPAPYSWPAGSAPPPGTPGPGRTPPGAAPPSPATSASAQQQVPPPFPQPPAQHAPQPPAQPPPASPWTPSGGAPAGPAPRDYAAVALAASLLPPWLLGGVARRWSRKVRQRYRAGDVEGAQQASRSAQAWAIAGLAVGSLVLLVVLLAALASSS